MSYFYGECHQYSKNSHKFYEIIHEPGSTLVVAEYGRLPGFGRAGTRNRYVYECISPYWAARKFDEKVSEKCYKKGYRATPDPRRAVDIAASTPVRNTKGIRVDEEGFETKLSEALDALVAEESDATIASGRNRWANLDFATEDEVRTGRLESTSAPSVSSGPSKRIAKMDFDPPPPPVKKSKRFARLDLD